ncbi:MAG: chromate resistance protein ChrB domain-containing protein [Vicinamibacterales bacterium]
MSPVGPPPRWLLFAFQLPTQRSNARVKTWRRLQQLGAVPTRNAVYVLPNTEACREDFTWLRAEIGASGGAATVFTADALDQEGEEDIVATSQQAREADYHALKRDADRLRAAATRKGGRAARDVTARSVQALDERFHQIERIDFHQARGRQPAAEALAALARAVAPAPPAPRATPEAVPLGQFRGRRWVTRPRPGIDRMASAWLIRRFIDPKARFAFVERPSPRDVPFDMYAGEFSHQGGRCTFEVLCDRFGAAGSAVTHIGHIVHDLDLKETKYAAPEAATVGRMVDGLRAVHADDAVLLEQGITMFEALARSFEAPEGEARKRPAARTAKKARR